MVGLGIGEAVLIVAIAAAMAIVFVGLGVSKKVRARGQSTELDRQVLDELEVLRLRLDLLTKRLDDAEIGGPPEDPLLPRGSE
jgi:hypothetical protein